jgi:predicted dehydrogenase
VECPEGAIELRRDEVHLRPADHPDQDMEVQMHRMPCEGQEFALLEFRQAVAEGREPEASGRDNLSSLAMVLAAAESARRGETVEIGEVLEA